MEYEIVIGVISAKFFPVLIIALTGESWGTSFKKFD